MPKSFRSVVKRHAHMVFDAGRTIPLIKAIQKKVKPGDIVVDVGCGLGILAFAACHAGAKRIYAIDVDSEAIEFARWQAKKLKMEKKICFLEDHSFNIDLIEKADLLIQETIGPLAFDENFLPTLIDAKKRFLKRNGEIIPREVNLMGALVGINKKLLTKPKFLAHVKTRSAVQNELVITKEWKLKNPETIQGILVWPHIAWAKELITNCAPNNPLSHWGQTLFPYYSKSNKHCSIRFSLSITTHSKDPLNYTDILWKCRGRVTETRRFPRARGCLRSGIRLRLEQTNRRF